MHVAYDYQYEANTNVIFELSIEQRSKWFEIARLLAALAAIAAS